MFATRAVQVPRRRTVPAVNDVDDADDSDDVDAAGAQPIVIHSVDDPRVAEYRSLKSPRVGAPWFVAESELVVQRLLTSAFQPRSFLLTPARYQRLGTQVHGRGAPVYLAHQAVMEGITGYDVHRGVLASVHRRSGPPLAQVLHTARRLLVLEGSNDAENIGVLARSARGLGYDALVLDPTCADPFSRRAVRVSMGEMLFLPVVRCPQWGDALAQIHAAGFAIWALTPDLAAAPLGSLDVPERLAVLVGAEGPGLTAAARAAATRQVRIPMHHGVDSLNLGHAAAIAMAFTAPAHSAPASAAVTPTVSEPSP